MANGTWIHVGTVLKKKDKEGTYFKVKTNVTLSAGQILNIQDPRKRPGITEEQLAKIPDFVKAELYLAPAKD